MDFDLTNACNLFCSHCSVSSGKPMLDESATSEILDTLGQLHELGVMSLTVAGGEPFIRPDIFEILGTACSLPGWRVTVITNGTFLTADVLERLSANCPNLAINVSVDGSTPSRFDYLRHGRRRTVKAQQELFTSVLDGLERTVKAGMDVQVSFTLSKANRDDLIPTYELVKSVGARRLIAIKFLPAGRGFAQRADMEFDFATWARYLIDLTECKASGAIPGISLSLPSAWEFYLPFEQASLDAAEAARVWRYHAPLEDKWFSAHSSLGDPSGITDLNVLSNGDVYPVTLMSGVPAARCGSMRTAELDDIWNESPVLQALRGMTRRDLPETCQSCTLEPVCGGGSRARAWILSGRLDGPDAACPRLQSA
ncbi:MAG: radical SAM protein [Jatrophihabitantaceae bacterium]